jgi:hypothetical protein
VPGSGSPPSTDPLTGAVTGQSASTADGTVSTAAGTPVSLAADHEGQDRALGWLAAAMLALAVLAPPFLVARHLRRRP